MSSMDEWRGELKDERAAFRRQGMHGIKSKIPFSKCASPGCHATITSGKYCRMCLTGDAYSLRMKHLQRHLCPRCRDPNVITNGAHCPACVALTAHIRKKDLHDAGNLERVKHMLKNPRAAGMRKGITRFDNSRYSLERSLPQLRVRMV
jgi:hypothetical protein